MHRIKTIIEASGLTATMHANGTNIEGEPIDTCKLAEECAALAEMGVQRTFFTLIFSTRCDKAKTLADRIAAVSFGNCRPARVAVSCDDCSER